MKILISLTFCLFLNSILSSVAMAKDWARPLSDYILSAEEINKLSSHEQKDYFHLVIYLTAIAELDGASKTDKYAHLNLNLNRLYDFSFVDDAAAEPLPKTMPVIAGKRDIRVGSLNGPSATWAEFNTELAELQREDLVKKKNVENSESYRVPRALCLFGGRASEYKRMGDGSVLCTRPKDSSCKKSGEEDSDIENFNCENFGLLQGPDSTAVAKKLCIPLYSKNGLDDLTFRCVGAASEWLEENPPTKLDANKWNVFATKIKAYLDSYEAQKAGKEITLSKYCANKNEINGSEQKNECRRVNWLIERLNKMSTVQKIIAARSVAKASSGNGQPAKASSAAP